jgi:hypothetical protein
VVSIPGCKIIWIKGFGSFQLIWLKWVESHGWNMNKNKLRT